MNRRPAHPFARIAIIGTVVAIGVGAGGCGKPADPGAASSLTVTSGFGQKVLTGPKAIPVTTGLTAMRQLQANASVKTSYGGRYVDAIDGTAGNAGSGQDWLFYVDGVQSDVGAAAWRVKPTQIVQWDFHQWRDLKAPEAIVGAYPFPLSNNGVNLVCKPKNADACSLARHQFPRAIRKSGAVTLVVGTWDQIAAVKGVPDLTQPAIDTGVFASFAGRPGARRLQLLGADGAIAQTLGAQGGLVAATREGKKITWLVTGVDERGVIWAASLLGPELQNKFAVATAGEESTIALPLQKAGSK